MKNITYHSFLFFACLMLTLISCKKEQQSQSNLQETKASPEIYPFELHTDCEKLIKNDNFAIAVELLNENKSILPFLNVIIDFHYVNQLNEGLAKLTTINPLIRKKCTMLNNSLAELLANNSAITMGSTVKFFCNILPNRETIQLITEIKVYQADYPDNKKIKKVYWNKKDNESLCLIKPWDDYDSSVFHQIICLQDDDMLKFYIENKGKKINLDQIYLICEFENKVIFSLNQTTGAFKNKVSDILGSTDNLDFDDTTDAIELEIIYNYRNSFNHCTLCICNQAGTVLGSPMFFSWMGTKQKFPKIEVEATPLGLTNVHTKCHNISSFEKKLANLNYVHQFVFEKATNLIMKIQDHPLLREKTENYITWQDKVQKDLLVMESLSLQELKEKLKMQEALVKKNRIKEKIKQANVLKLPFINVNKNECVPIWEAQGMLKSVRLLAYYCCLEQLRQRINVLLSCQLH